MVTPTWTMRLATHAHDLDADGHDAYSGPIDIFIGPFDPRAFTQTGAMTAANYAFITPFQVYKPHTVTTATTYVAVQSGNISVGIYDAAGTRLGTTGGIACPAAGERTVSFTAGIALEPGVRYYLGYSADNTTVAIGIRHGIIGMSGYEGPGNYPLPASVTPPGSAALESWLWVLKE